MSRCKACDTILKQGELSRKDNDTGQHVDLCSVCFYVSDRASSEYDFEELGLDLPFNDDKEYTTW